MPILLIRLVLWSLYVSFVDCDALTCVCIVNFGCNSQINLANYLVDFFVNFSQSDRQLLDLICEVIKLQKLFSVSSIFKMLYRWMLLTYAMYSVFLHCRAWLRLNEMLLKWYCRDEHLVCCVMRITECCLKDGLILPFREKMEKAYYSHYPGWGICWVLNYVFFLLLCFPLYLFDSFYLMCCMWWLSVLHLPGFCSVLIHQNILFVYRYNIFLEFINEKKETSVGSNMV